MIVEGINVIPNEQEKFYREYIAFLDDLISHYDGRSTLHADLY